jgi:hypothetical protein
MSNMIRRTVILISLIGCLTCAFLWWWPAHNAEKKDETKYQLTAYTTDTMKVGDIKTNAEAKGYSVETKLVTLYKKRKIGYRVAFHYSDKVALENMVERIKRKHYNAQVVEDSDTNDMFIQAGGNFKNKAQALVLRKKMIDITTMDFKVEDNFDKFPYKATSITISNIIGKEAVDNIRAEIKPFIEIGKSKVEVMPLKNSPPEATKGKDPKPGAGEKKTDKTTEKPASETDSANPKGEKEKKEK